MYLALVVVLCPYVRLRSQPHRIEVHQGNLNNEGYAHNKCSLVRCQLDDGSFYLSRNILQ